MFWPWTRLGYKLGPELIVTSRVPGNFIGDPWLQTPFIIGRGPTLYGWLSLIWWTDPPYVISFVCGNSSEIVNHLAIPTGKPPTVERCMVTHDHEQRMICTLQKNNNKLIKLCILLSKTGLGICITLAKYISYISGDFRLFCWDNGST